MSPILGTVNSILSRKKIFFTVSPLPAPVHKKCRDNIEKNSTSSRHLLPVKLSKILANITELANPLKKNLANAPADLKKTKSKTKKMMGLQRFLLYKLFLSSRCDRKLENSGEKQTERGAYPKSALRAAAPSMEGVKKTRVTV